MDKRWPPCVGFFGFILLLMGMVCALYINPLIEDHYFSRQTLENGSVSYQQFVDPTFNLKKFKVYFFEVVNVEGVVKNNEQPIVEEVGPYVYDVKIKRTIESINRDTSTVEFYETNNYIFNLRESKGRTEEDTVYILNVILGIIENKLKTTALLPKNLEQEMLNDLKMETFEKTKVKNILFDGLILDCSSTTATACEYLTMDKSPYVTLLKNKLKISFFGHLNNTKIGPFQMYYGKEKFQRGNIVSFNGMTKWKDWKPPGECHVFKGSNLFWFPVLPFAIPHLYLFLSELCRSMPLDFGNYTNYRSVPTYKYISIKKPFDNIKENACYCKGTTFKKYTVTCNIKGTMDLSECKKIPLIASYPHFYLGDPSLLTFVQGLAPEKGLHESFVSIEPRSGVRFASAFRLQLNIKVSKLKQGEDESKTQGGLFPVLWSEEIVNPTQDFVYHFESRIFHMKVLRFVKYFLAFSGIFIMSFSVVLLAYRERYLAEYRPRKRNDFSVKILTENSDLNKINVNLYPQLINRNVCDSFDRKNGVPKF